MKGARLVREAIDRQVALQDAAVSATSRTRSVFVTIRPFTPDLTASSARRRNRSRSDEKQQPSKLKALPGNIDGQTRDPDSLTLTKR
ncbi:hypothetical protein MRX96_011229 [Rhipicephalus microplus]